MDVKKAHNDNIMHSIFDIVPELWGNGKLDFKLCIVPKSELAEEKVVPKLFDRNV